MGKDFLDEFYKMMDPLGIHDKDKDGHYDFFERAVVDEEEREMREAYEKSQEKVTTDFGDDDEDDFSDELDDDIDEGDFENPHTKMLCNDDGDDDLDDIDEVDDAGESDSGISIELSISVSTRKPSADGGVTSRREEAEGTLPYLKSCRELDEQDRLRMRRCEFILSQNCIAAQYCDELYGFELVDAVVHGHGLPKEFTDYYSTDDILCDLMRKIAEYNVDLAVEIWAWLVKEFTPYACYDEEGVQDITTFSLGYPDDMPKGFAEKVYDYIAANTEFFLSIIRERDSVLYGYEQFIFMALKRNNGTLAVQLLQGLLDDAKIKLGDKADMVSDLLDLCYTDTETGGMDAFVSFILPRLKELKNPILDKRMVKWEKDIEEYKESLADEDD